MIATPDWESHYRTVEEVKKRLKAYGFPINESKSDYFQQKIRHLGYLLDATACDKGIRLLPDPSKVDDLIAMPEPNNLPAIQRFIGAVGFYAKFIDGFSDIVRPLRDMVTSKEFNWSTEARQAFETLKFALVSGILKPFNPYEPIEVICDASPTAVGAVMQQKGRPVLYISKTLSAAERNYSQLDREGPSIVYAIRRLHKYLYGHKFKIVTDHRPLEFLFKPSGCRSAHANQRVLRWAMFLASYDYEIVGKRSEEIPVADMLSMQNRKQTTFRPI